MGATRHFGKFLMKTLKVALAGSCHGKLVGRGSSAPPQALPRPGAPPPMTRLSLEADHPGRLKHGMPPGSGGIPPGVMRRC